MGLTEFLFIFLLLAFSAPVTFVVCGAVGALLEEARDGGTPCTPTRHANITASAPQTQRRMVYERTLSPPAGWHEPQHVAIVPAPTTTHAPAPRRTRRAVPEVVPVAVPDWPTRQTVEPEAVPVVVNHTAARFSALEFRR